MEVEQFDKELMLLSKDSNSDPNDVIFFDLEHYVYKKPKCIGVFGACIYNESDNKLYVTQYMIENKDEVVEILYLAKKYFKRMKKIGKKTIVTFSGNNDFTVINHLFKKYNIVYDFNEEFEQIDIQKEYERVMNTSIGLKNLEKLFLIHREGEVMSGSNLAKTFHKVLKDREYMERIPKDKIQNILLYNEQDVVNLYKIFATWNTFIGNEDLEDDKPLMPDALEEELDDDLTEEFDLSDINIENEALDL